MPTATPLVSSIALVSASPPGDAAANGHACTGQGYHADFINGWEPDFLQEVIGTCTNLSGQLTDCPLLTLQSEHEQQQCSLTPPGILANEFMKAKSSSLLDALPGNVKIQYGPESATPPGKDGDIGDAITSWFGGIGKDASTTTTTPTSYSAPTLTYKPASSSSGSPPGPLGGAFIESSPSTSSGLPVETPTAPSVNVAAAVPSPSTTPAPAPSSEPGVSYEVVSTQTVTEGARIQEIVWEEPVVYVTEDSVTTKTVLPGGGEFVKSEHKGKARRSHMRRHGHHGHN